MSDASKRLGTLSPERLALLERMLEKEGQEAIAIVGLACRFPGGADTPEAFWQNLWGGVDAIDEIPPERWLVDDYYDPTAGVPGKSNSRWAGLVRGLDMFDPAFFRIAPREAAFIDPQQRMSLETAWEALESAGVPADKLAGTRTGVFLGIAQQDYGTIAALLAHGAPVHSPFSSTGVANSIAANRISYELDLRGPSVSIDTACSSSLVAIHLACDSLRKGECELALAGGVNAILLPDISVRFSNSGFLSPDGRCRAFDHRANGYVRGEGAGMVVLKLLSSALADGDNIWAVIRGSAVNQDGRTNGLTAPNRHAQEAVIRDALDAAAVTSADVQYVEAHGSGTPIGDPIEVGALGSALGEGHTHERYLALGSVKTNIGHLEAAAGIAGLTKVVLALKHRRLPQNLHFVSANPHIPFDTLPIRVQAERGEWPRPHEPLIAGVSAFSFGGTNAHVILEEAPRRERDVTPAPPEPPRARVLALSAQSKEALDEQARRFATFLGSSSTAVSFADVCFTTTLRRAHLSERMTVVARDKAEAADRLRAYARGEMPPGLAVGTTSDERPRVAFFFPGQGSQWLGMGKRLLAEEPAFRAAIERADRAVREAAGWSVLEELGADEKTSRLEEFEIVPPLLFSVQVAIAELFRGWGVVPDAVVGHSMGEIAASCVAGALTVEDAARVICIRTRLFSRLRGRGATAVVELSRAEAEETIARHGGAVSIAAINGPRSIVLSGSQEAVEAALAEVVEKKRFGRLVKVQAAAHCSQIDELEAELLEQLAWVVPRAPAIPIYSTAHAELVQPVMDASYWWRNFRQPVQFMPRVQDLAAQGFELFVEISPHPLLTTAVTDILRDGRRDTRAKVMASFRRGPEEREDMLATLGALHSAGYPVDWTRHANSTARLVDLPLYPWQKQRHWLADLAAEKAPPEARVGSIRAGAHSLLQRHWELSASPGIHCWESRPADALAAGKGESIGDALAEAVVTAANEAYGAGPYVVESLVVERAPDANGRLPTSGQLVFTPRKAGVWSISYATRDGVADPWTRNVSGEVVRSTSTDVAKVVWISDVKSRCTPVADPAPFLRPLVGGTALKSIVAGDGETLAEIDDHVRGHGIASMLGLFLRAAPAALLGGQFRPLEIVSLSGVRASWESGGPPAWIYVKSANVGSFADAASVTASVLDATGRVLMEVRQATLEPARGVAQAVVEERPSRPVDMAVGVRARLAAATDQARLELLEDLVLSELAQALRVSKSHVSPHVPFKRLGLESLLAVELRNRLERLLELPLAVGVIWAYPTVAALAPFLVKQMGFTVPQSVAPPTPASFAEGFEAQTLRMTVLSEDAARNLLEEELHNLTSGPPSQRALNRRRGK